MSSGLCKVSLLGNLTANAELKQVGGDSVCNIRLAVNESFKTRNGEKKERTEFFAATLWGRRGEALAPHLTKGTRVYIDGNLSTRTYEHNGTTRTSLEVKVNELVFAGGGRSEGGNRNESRGNDEYPEASADTGYAGPGVDDLPFREAEGP